MKTLASTIAAVFLVLFVLTTFVPYPAARESAYQAGFKEKQIETGLQYGFERRLFFWGWTALELSLLAALALTSAGRRLADRFIVWTGGRRIVAVLGVGLTFAVLREILYLPIGFGSLCHQRSWGMTERTVASWLQDHAIAFGVNLVGEAIIVAGLYTLLIALPRVWWLVGTLGATILGVAYVFLLPIVINPLFNDFTPLSQTEWADQEPRVQALIDKAGVPVQEILVVNASRQSNHSNAYFTGFGPTRRIVLYDNLLKKHSPDQIESILGHELGHWRHDHIVKGILLAIPAVLLGLFLLDRVLRAAVGRGPWRLMGIADPAGLPLILLVVYIGAWALLPVQNAVSRHFEQQADQSALELAGRPQAFIDAEKKLADDNKANVAPTPWNVWLFSTHPPAVERIRMAREWEK